jgi:hypothetical protein
MRFAAHILLFDCDQFILRAINNIAPWVDRIYVAYSPNPWGYNESARDNFANTTDPGILRQSPHSEKITLIQGDWLTEEAHRLRRTRARGGIRLSDHSGRG